jgi:hypothetical protein
MTYRYKTVKINGKTKLLHRHLMEQHIGRALTQAEHVHHVNGDRYDNRIENLQLIDGKEHLAEHGEERLIHSREKTCEVCGSKFTPKPAKRKRQRTCGTPQCANKLRSMTERQTKSKPPLASALVKANLADMAAQRRAA